MVPWASDLSVTTGSQSRRDPHTVLGMGEGAYQKVSITRTSVWRGCWEFPLVQFSIWDKTCLHLIKSDMALSTRITRHKIFRLVSSLLSLLCCFHCPEDPGCFLFGFLFVGFFFKSCLMLNFIKVLKYFKGLSQQESAWEIRAGGTACRWVLLSSLLNAVRRRSQCSVQ